MEKTVDALRKELVKIRTGIATPAMLDNITVDYYGTPTPIKHIANITVPEPRTLSIHPFEKKMLSAIDKAIQLSELGLPPNNDGESIRINLPMLTTERRKDLAKQVRSVGEEAKVGIRNIRRDENDEIKKQGKLEAHSEDETKGLLNKVQIVTDEYIVKLEKVISEKETDIMHV